MTVRQLVLACGWASYLMWGGSAFGQVITLDYPLPEQWRARAEVMMLKLRPNDATEALASIRTHKYISPTDEWMIFRVEADCRIDLCMTMIARNAREGIKPELIFNSGKEFYVFDAAYPLWGRDASLPLVFEGEGGAALRVVYRSDHIVVEACVSCSAWRKVLEQRRPELPAPPETPLKSMSFEEFKQALGL